MTLMMLWAYNGYLVTKIFAESPASCFKTVWFPNRASATDDGNICLYVLSVLFLGTLVPDASRASSSFSEDLSDDHPHPMRPDVPRSSRPEWLMVLLHFVCFWMTAPTVVTFPTRSTTLTSFDQSLVRSMVVERLGGKTPSFCGQMCFLQLLGGDQEYL